MTGPAVGLPRGMVPILKPQPGVCRVCRQWSGRYPTCWACRENCEALGLNAAPVLPMALAVKAESLASALWEYKDAAGEVATYARGQLMALTSAFMPHHERCLAAAHGCAAFDIITYVPSSRGRPGNHPVRGLLAEVEWSRARLEDLLVVNNLDVPAHKPAHDKFRVVEDVSRYTVLLVDDTWTRGANALSAVTALRAAGASRVGVAVIGRHVDDAFQDSHVYSDEARRIGFDARYCALCDPRPVADPPLPLRVASRQAGA